MIFYFQVCLTLNYYIKQSQYESHISSVVISEDHAHHAVL